MNHKMSNLALSISRGTFQLRLNIARGAIPSDPVIQAASNDACQPEGSIPALPFTEDAPRLSAEIAVPQVAMAPSQLTTVPGAGPSRPGTASLPDTAPVLSGQNCTVVYTDVVGFADRRRTERDRLAIRHATAIMTMRALGPLWESCSWADRGDGMLIVIPPGIPTAAVVSRLLSVLPGELSAHNAGSDLAARVQMRVAIEVGPLVTDSFGVSGDAIILAARMLEVPALKRAIAQGMSPLGVITSAFVFDTVVRNCGDTLGAADYVSVQVKVKNSRIVAWFRLVG